MLGGLERMGICKGGKCSKIWIEFYIKWVRESTREGNHAISAGTRPRESTHLETETFLLLPPPLLLLLACELLQLRLR